MKKVAYSVAAYFMLAASCALAAPADYCGIALTEKAYDRSSSSIRQNIVFASRDELCDEEYSSIGEAQSAARSRGFSLGYSGLSIGASEAKQSGNSKWNISSTKFCTASDVDLKSSYESNYDSQVASIAVNAWLQCVKSSNENSLYLEYEVAKDGQYFTGTLHTTASTGVLGRKITGIAVVGEASPTVKCNIGGKEYSPNDPSGAPIEVETTGTAIACGKSGEQGVSIGLQTSQGSVPFVKLPSKVELSAGEFDQLKAEIDTLGLKFAMKEESDATVVTGLREEAAASEGRVSSRFDRIKLTKACVPRESNSCRPWDAPPACPSGYRNTGLTEENYWGGGACGYGTYCIVCYSDQ